MVVVETNVMGANGGTILHHRKPLSSKMLKDSTRISQMLLGEEILFTVLMSVPGSRDALCYETNCRNFDSKRL